jgi:glucose-6-phosphate 1-dehydrogenase
MGVPECTIILFGATGDLAKKKLFPALADMHARGTLPKATRIVAIGRRQYTTRTFLDDVKASCPRCEQWSSFQKRVQYQRLEFHDPGAYEELGKLLEKCPANRLFYLATPQDVFGTIIERLGNAGIAKRAPKGAWHRVVFEKPFGSDLASAQQLNTTVAKLFAEEQIYRIDHYLGKGLVQEVFALRFANPIFEHLWNNRFIDNVQIVISETGGVGTRGGYYDNAGAIRDMVQNHMLQLLSLIAMERPSAHTAASIKEEKVKVLRTIAPDHIKLVRGQYGAGVAGGKKVRPYLEEEGVRKGSDTETFAAARIEIANTRWEGVPFYLRTGKALKHQYAQIAVTFQQGPCDLFVHGCPETNILVIRIQPDEGIKLRFNLAEQQQLAVRPREMTFCHNTTGFNTPQAYELLLAECMQGDQTLFTDWAFLEQAWRIADGMRSGAPRNETYPAGSHGPAGALELVTREGRDWIGNSELTMETSVAKKKKKKKKATRR